MIHVNFPHVKALLPIGISFSTLQSIGYLLDVRSGKVKPEKHFGYFAIFSCFFPQLSAGPIQRAGTLLTQLQKKQVFQYGQVADGAKRFLFGLFKKIVIADNLGSVVDRIFASLPEYKGISLIFTMFLYTWQIYMDFSGYTDMARGTAQMLGITLTENFRLPYFATSLRDFWKRWHISLSSWLRDYLYIPLGGNRHGLIRTVINTLLVFTISGLWHGAAWNFVLWGFLYGVMLSLEKLLKKIAENRIVIPTNIKILYTYSVISILWVFFRAPTIQDALYILRNSFVGMKHFFSPEYLLASINQIFVFNHAEILIISVLLILAMIIEYIRRKTSLLQLINRQPMLLRFVFYSLILLAIIQLRNARIQEFIYVQF
jgi:D-alanyl-lipoteichoic acid acyltransferase DltB (MBOAT superfamily)